MGERQPAKHHAPSRRKRRLSGRSASRAFFSARVGRGHAQTGRLCNLASGGSVAPCSVLSPPWAAFEPFLSGPGSVSDSLRHSVCKAHITSKHSLASKTAAQRIKADICGSALPPSRNE